METYQKELDQIVNMLAKHLGSIEAALLWLHLDDPSWGKRPMDVIKEGNGKLLMELLEQQWSKSALLLIFLLLFFRM
jgi:hypothetical protein